MYPRARFEQVTILDLFDSDESRCLSLFRRNDSTFLDRFLLTCFVRRCDLCRKDYDLKAVRNQLVIVFRQNFSLFLRKVIWLPIISQLVMNLEIYLLSFPFSDVSLEYILKINK